MSGTQTKADLEMWKAITLGSPFRVIAAGDNSNGVEKVSDEQFAKMTPAQRLDHCRQFPQHKSRELRQDNSAMPEWKDPRPPGPKHGRG